MIFSVQPLCSLCLSGGFTLTKQLITETQRTQRLHREDKLFPSDFEFDRVVLYGARAHHDVEPARLDDALHIQIEK